MGTNMGASLLDLAERCEAATGPDLALNDDIARARAKWEHRLVWSGLSRPYTASLDAAMTLVPEGWRVGQLEEDWRSGRWHGRVCQRASAKLVQAFDDGKTIGYDSKEAEAATPALALCAAALRSRTQERGDA